MSDDDIPNAVGRPWAGIIVMALVVCVVGAGIAFAVTSGAPASSGVGTRIVLASVPHEDPDDLVSMVQGQFERALHDYGFEVVVEASAETPEAARELALLHDAGHTLLLELDSEVERPGLANGMQALRTSLTYSLVSDDPERPVQTGSAEFLHERSSPRAAVHAVVGTLRDYLAPDILETVMGSPAMSPERLPIEVAGAEAKLHRQDPLLSARREQLERYARYCADAQDDVVGLSGEGVTCAGEPCGQLSLVGAGQDRAWVQDVGRTPFFELGAPTIGWLEPPESLASTSGDGEITPLYRAGHFYAFGSTDRSGRYISALPFAGTGELGVVVVDTTSGELTASHVLPERVRAHWARPSSDGERVLVRIVHGPLRVLQPGGPTDILGDDANWVPHEGREALLVRRGDRLRMTGTDGGPLSAELTIPRRMNFAGVHEADAFWISREGRDCDLHQLALQTMTEEPPIRLDYCLDQLSMTPDGRILGMRDGRGEAERQVVLLSTRTGEMRTLTNGAFQEEAPFATRNGRIVFNRRLPRWPDEWNLGIYRRVVCSMDLPE